MHVFVLVCATHFFRMSSFRPVSYTHLDVYKRQLIGLFNFNLVEAIFGDALLSAIIYMIVGIAGIINIMLLFTDLDQ